MQSKEIDQIKKLYNQSKEQALNDLITFLSFPSISSEPENSAHMLACANWLQRQMASIGFSTEIWNTSKHPVLYGEKLDAGPNKPTLLIYNHYDVQPVDPVDLWDFPPFQPTIRNGQIFARGAQDNKGQCFYVLQALRLLKEKSGSFPINIKWLIEGEEEVGSKGLEEILHQKKDRLKSDWLAIVDLGIPASDIPAITLGTRGIVTMDVAITESNTDLHSGSHGGIVYNPIHALVEVLSRCRDKEGKIQIPGFYDEVRSVDNEEKKQLFLKFNQKNYTQTFGAEPTGGEAAFSPLERAWIRPTLEINGIFGGYAGEGFKTVIPSKAGAKISCRLVPDQDPKTIGRLVADYLKLITPKGLEIQVDIHPGSGGACRSDPRSRGVAAFSKAYEEVFQKPIHYIYEGGSIPIINALAKASESEVLLLGLGLKDDNMHAPNEHFGLDRLEKGAIIMARGIENLAQLNNS